MNKLIDSGAPQIGVLPSQFSFTLDRFPQTSFLVQDVSIPSVNFGRATLQTPLQDLNFPGDQLTYSDLTVEFVLDSNLQNYIELYGWMRGLGFAESRDDYAAFVQRRAKQVGATTKNRILAETTVAKLTALNQQGKPTFQFIFLDVFPVALSSLNFDTQTDNSQMMKCSATFCYNYFNVELADSSTLNYQNVNSPISEIGVNNKFKVYD